MPVLGPLVLYSWLCLRWAIEQFQREEVLFREADRLDLGLLAAAIVPRQGTPTDHGEAVFRFAPVIALLGLVWV